MDCRHGRALFLSKGQRDTMELIVWEPITGALQRVPVPAAAAFKSDHPTAAVFCASDGCDHRDCLGGPFRVVFVFGLCFCDDDDNDQCVTSACVYSSESGTWGELTSMDEQFGNFGDHSSVLVGRSLLYFMSYGGLILEYDLSRDSMTWLDTPCEHYPNPEQMNLMLMEEGGLGVTEVLESHLKLWSREVSDDPHGRWVLSRDIYLENLLPNGALEGYVYLLGFAEGANVIFMITVAGLFAVELQPERARKVCDGHGFFNLIPVVSFYTPHCRLQALGGIDHDPPPRPNPTQGVGGWQGGGDEKSLEQAQQLFDKGWKALKETDFANAINCFSHTLKIRVVHYGVLAPECASTFYGYGRALLSKALKESNPSGIVSKNASNKESAESTATTSKNAAARSSKTCSNTEHVPPLEKGDSEGKYLNERGQGDENMTSNEDSDLDLAWKMMNMARATVAKIPDKTMEKANYFML
uniref:F-box protein AT5G49610-like beta-propeller domain-containing protein n=1 Tax=Hordeum vulgare subsp. vulgare TaxID=112509 RepID=A0A8I6XVM0_HORVV